MKHTKKSPQEKFAFTSAYFLLGQQDKVDPE